MIDEFYFRFNLTSDEIKEDRLLFMERAGELFSQNGRGDLFSHVGELYTTGNRYSGALLEYEAIHSYLYDMVWLNHEVYGILLEKSYSEDLNYFYDFVNNSDDNNFLISHFIHHTHDNRYFRFN